MFRRDARSVCGFSLSVIALVVGGVSDVGAVEGNLLLDLSVEKSLRSESSPPREEIMINDNQISALVVDGRELNIDGSIAQDDYLVRNKGVLNAQGATLGSVSVENRGVLNLHESVVNGGVNIYQAFANIKSTTINGLPGATATLVAGLALASEHISSVVTVSDSTVFGDDTAVLAGPLSVVSLANTTVISTGGSILDL